MTDLYFGQGCRPAHFCHDPQAPPRRVSPDHFQVYSGVRIGTIYCTHQHPGGNEWMWFLNGFTNGPVRFNGFAVTLDDAKAEFAASWHAWLGRGADRRHAHGGKLILAARPQGVNKGEAAGRGKKNNEERVVKRHSNKRDPTQSHKDNGEDEVVACKGKAPAAPATSPSRDNSVFAFTFGGQHEFHRRH